MKVLISGASGLVGTALASALRASGREPVALVRGQGGGGVHWDPNAGTIDAGALEDLGAVVHLAGENIASGRWSAEKKRRIRDSRVQGTRLLCDALAGCAKRPETLIAASAIGYYGNRGAEILDEDSAPGAGFLAEVCQEWEAACAPARDAGIRVVNLRFGVVLSPEGGALQKMLLPFRLGLGGRVGDGAQYMSWLSLADAVGAVQFALDTPALTGPVNAVTPNPVTNADFTKALAGALRRPALLPAPAFALRAALGEMADEMLLSSVRVLPKRLGEAGFVFDHPELAGALEATLG